MRRRRWAVRPPHVDDLGAPDASADIARGSRPLPRRGHDRQDLAAVVGDLVRAEAGDVAEVRLAGWSTFLDGGERLVGEDDRGGESAGPSDLVAPFAQRGGELLVVDSGALEAATEGAFPAGDQTRAADAATIRRFPAGRLPRRTRTPLPHQPGGGRLAARPAAGAHGGQEPAGLALPSRPRTGQRPRDHQPVLGPRHSDVEEPPLLLDPGVGVRVDDGEVALGGADDEDHGPLEALRGVQGRDRHPVGGRRMRELCTTLELLHELGHRAASRGGDLLGQGQDRGEGLPALAGRSPAGRPGRQPPHAREDGVRLLHQSVGGVRGGGARGGVRARGGRHRRSHVELSLTRGSAGRSCRGGGCRGGSRWGRGCRGGVCRGRSRWGRGHRRG